MSQQVTVLDLGAGNLWNLERALRHLGAEVEVTTAADRVAAARCLVLPGVGAFAPARAALRGDRETALRLAVADGAWLLGICLGYQLLFEESEEFGATAGLGLLPGRITRLPDSVPVPHIGWNRLHDVRPHPLLDGLIGPERNKKKSWVEKGGSGSKVAGAARSTAQIGAGALAPAQISRSARDDAGQEVISSSASSFHLFFYFVHSFAPEGVPEDLGVAYCNHGRPFPAVVARGRVLGTQFHPERSSEAGLRLLSNFLEMAHDVARPRAAARA
jgi:glutamine amidotransferase